MFLFACLLFLAGIVVFWYQFDFSIPLLLHPLDDVDRDDNDCPLKELFSRER